MSDSTPAPTPIATAIVPQQPEAFGVPSPPMVAAVAELAGAVAWPLLAALALVLFRRELGGLIRRLRETFGTKFDPPDQSEAPSASGVTAGRTRAAPPSSLEGVPLPLPRTEASAQWEEVAVNTWLANVPDENRATVFLACMGRVMLVAQFQNLELYIWGSQLEVLSHLNERVDGETLPNLKAMYYDSAAEKHPDLFGSYPFEQYLAFLVRGGAVFVTPERDRAVITSAGREYLSWRVEMRRGRRMVG